MCGICGWIDYEDDLTRARATLQSMADSLAHRGPDSAGLWLSPSAALGHRRLAVIDIERGRQPMVCRVGGHETVLLHSGEVYNYRQLRTELVSRGHRFETSSDTEVVLRGYLQWGEDVTSRLVGMYAFAVWDERERELLLVRDRLGIKPLYYSVLPKGVIFGSEPKALFATGLLDPALDEDGVRELLSLVRTPGHAIFKGVREVPAGHVVCVNRAGTTEKRYWRVTAREHSDNLSATIRGTRGLLEEAVEEQLVSDVPLCTLLSGGLDSSSVTALAQHSLKAQGLGPVRSFSVEFSSSSAFQANAMQDTPDAPFVRDLAGHVSAAHTEIFLDADDLLHPSVWQETLKARDLPPIGDMDSSLYLVCKTIRRHATVALSGEGADEVFGGYRWFHDREAIAADTFPWLAMARRFGRETPFEPRLLRGLDVVSYQRDKYAEAIAEVPKLSGETGLERRMREICYLHLTRFLQNPLDRKDRMSMAVGLEMRVPFCDHRLVDYVFNAPWAMKSFDGREKSLLRAAVSDLLPASVLLRRKSPFPSIRDPRYHEALRVHASRLLDDGSAPVLRLINRPTVRALAAMPPNGSPVVQMGLERVLRLNDWLEGYGVDVEI